MEIVKINYDFYKDYLEDPNFLNLFNIRKNEICDRHKVIEGSEDYIVQNYFVELFSWTAIPLSLLCDINKLISWEIPNYTILDPCCGSSFHGALFNYFCHKDVVSIDIQPEPNCWMPTINGNGLEYLSNLENIRSNTNNIVLLLSWIDWTKEELAYNLLKKFQGKYVISIGNYTNIDNKKYLDELKENFVLIKGYLCNMPWKSNEEIQIFKRK